MCFSVVSVKAATLVIANWSFYIKKLFHFLFINGPPHLGAG